MWLYHVIQEVYHTAIDAPHRSWHCLRYGPKEIRGILDETGKPRGGDPETPHLVPRL